MDRVAKHQKTIDNKPLDNRSFRHLTLDRVRGRDSKPIADIVHCRESRSVQNTNG